MSNDNTKDDHAKARAAFIEAQIARTLKPYEGIATPEMIAQMREQLGDMLATHPVAVGLVEQLVERASPMVTGEVPRDAAEADNAAEGGKGGA